MSEFNLNLGNNQPPTLGFDAALYQSLQGRSPLVDQVVGRASIDPGGALARRRLDAWQDFIQNPDTTKARFLDDGKGGWVFTKDIAGNDVYPDGSSRSTDLYGKPEPLPTNRLEAEYRNIRNRNRALQGKDKAKTGSIYAVPNDPLGREIRDSIHGQVGQRHFSTADDTIDPDPVQGADVDVWVERYGDPDDPVTRESRAALKNHVLLGSFQEITIKIASKPLRYYEVDSRNPVLIDDEWTIFFTLGKGLIDMEVLEHTFGLRHIHQLARFNRLPRLRITFNSDPRSLDPLGRPRGELNQSVRTHGWVPDDLIAPERSAQLTQADLERELIKAQSTGVSRESNLRDLNLKSFTENRIDQVQTDEQGGLISTAQRYPIGRWVLEGARCNELILHAAGVKVVQNQWQGEAESLRALSFEEPPGDDAARSFRPFYKNADIEGLPDRLMPRHLDADIGPAATTRDPVIEAYFRQQRLANLISATGDAVLDGLSGALRLPLQQELRDQRRQGLV